MSILRALRNAGWRAAGIWECELSRPLAENSSAHCALANEATNSDACFVSRRLQEEREMQGARVLILTGEHKGEQGVCLGEAGRAGRWAISPDDSGEILSLVFERDFGLLVDLSVNPRLN